MTNIPDDKPTGSLAMPVDMRINVARMVADNNWFPTFLDRAACLKCKDQTAALAHLYTVVYNQHANLFVSTVLLITKDMTGTVYPGTFLVGAHTSPDGDIAGPENPNEDNATPLIVNLYNRVFKATPRLPDPLHLAANWPEEVV